MHPGADLDLLITSRYPIVAVDTLEQERLEEFCRDTAGRDLANTGCVSELLGSGWLDSNLYWFDHHQRRCGCLSRQRNYWLSYSVCGRSSRHDTFQ